MKPYGKHHPGNGAGLTVVDLLSAAAHDLEMRAAAGQEQAVSETAIEVQAVAIELDDALARLQASHHAWLADTARQCGGMVPRGRGWVRCPETASWRVRGLTLPYCLLHAVQRLHRLEQRVQEYIPLQKAGGRGA